LEGLEIENIVLYSGLLKYFTTIGSIFSLLCYIVPRKIWQPWWGKMAAIPRRRVLTMYILLSGEKAE
jgi:hypothetical protein